MGKSISACAAEKKDVWTLKFCERLKNASRDQLVFVIQEEGIKKRMVADLIFKRAFEIAKAVAEDTTELQLGVKAFVKNLN